MLNFSNKQMDYFNSKALNGFVDEMVIHSHNFSPKLCQIIGDEQLSIALQQAIKRANGYGLTKRGPVRLYIDLNLLFGSHFDTDPLFSPYTNILVDDSDQMFRADQMHDVTLKYLEKVHGEGNINVFQSLSSISSSVRMPLTVSAVDFETTMLLDLKTIFPQRASFVGDEALSMLIEQARLKSAELLDQDIQYDVLILFLMFAFGHGCTRDPLYPWITNTLSDPKIKDPSSRAIRLKKKALTWLDHVLENWETI